MTQEDKAILAEVAISEDQAEKEVEDARDLAQAVALSLQDEGAARVVDDNLVSLTETER